MLKLKLKFMKKRVIKKVIVKLYKCIVCKLIKIKKRCPTPIWKDRSKIWITKSHFRYLRHQNAMK